MKTAKRIVLAVALFALALTAVPVVSHAFTKDLAARGESDVWRE